MDKSQVYGSSAVGVDPKTTSIQKGNLAVAMGTLYQGPSRTLAIEWMYGPDAQPDTRNPLLALREWLRFLDTTDISVVAIEKAWCRRYASLQASYSANDPQIWDSVTSAMSASVLHLIQLEVRQVACALWLRTAVGDVEDASSGTARRLDMRCPLRREENLSWIESGLPERMWSDVAEHHANSGLWTGEPPILEPTKKFHQKLLADGKVQEAMALQAAVTHNVWPAARATDDPLLMMCTRCNLEPEALFHRHWTCPNLELADHLAVSKTQISPSKGHQ